MLPILQSCEVRPLAPAKHKHYDTISLWMKVAHLTQKQTVVP